MRKALIIIVIIIVVGAAAFGGLLYLKGNQTTVNPDGTTTPGNGITLRDFFPFGSTSKVDNNEIPLTPDTTPVDTTPTDNTKPEQKLIQVSANPVAGFGFAMVDVAPDANNVVKEFITVKSTITFKKDLELKKKDTEVKELQKLFNQCQELQIAPSGVGSKGKESTTFDTATESAVKIFQTIFKNIDPETKEPLAPTGKVDAQTREKLNVPFDCTKPQAPLQIEKKGALRYVQKTTGHVYETLIGSTDIKKITNTTIPRVHEAIFIPGTDNVILRYLKDQSKVIQSFMGTVATHTIGKDEGPSELKGTFLPENILDASAAPSNGKLFYLTKYNQGTAGDVLLPAQNKTTQVLSSAFTEWKSQYANPSTVVITTKASSKVPGFSYLVDTDTKAFTKLIGNIAGLTVLMNPDKTKFLYGSTVGNDATLTLYNKTDKSRTVLTFTTLPAKCVWASATVFYCGAPVQMPQGEYPDAWYQGLVSFADKIWKVDTASGTSLVISDPIQEVGQEIDAISLKLDTIQDKLFFINKKDSSLWSLKLN